MSAPPPRPIVVIKFGGSSVATAKGWATIADRARALRAEHRRVVIVASALKGVTDALTRAVDEARHGRGEDVLAAIRAQHEALAHVLGLDGDSLAPVAAILDEAERRLSGVRLTGEAPPRLVARVLAAGELASTRLGIAALAVHGVLARWLDARDLLVSRPRRVPGEDATYLDARVATRRDPDAFDASAGDAPVVLTQGFIARTPAGETCLLGRGGSDTSAALLAALAGAEALELWSDVPGLFTADPHTIPSARLIRRVGYAEARELAATGAKVLHPPCLDPVEEHGVAVRLRSTQDPALPGTEIVAEDEDHPAVNAVTLRTGVVLVSLSSIAMWEEPGYLARVFEPFRDLGISVDLIGTSQTAVTVTLDRLPGGVEGETHARLVERLAEWGRVETRHPCAVVSIVGRRLRGELHDVGPALAAFRDRPVHLVSNSAQDLNLAFVVDEADARALVTRLHALLFGGAADDARLGPTWEQLAGRGSVAAATAAERGADRWWRGERSRLQDAVADGRARYVYHLPTVRERAGQLRAAVPGAEIYYSIKANSHPAILEALAGEGLGLECVSLAEIERVRAVTGPATPVLFTPNFCPAAEYERARALGATLIFDSVEGLALAASAARGAEIALRVDPGRGRGHHDKVRTAGAHAKFGLPEDDAPAFARAAAETGARVVGLHAHVGSGILDPEAWNEVGARLGALVDVFPDVRWIDVGGGLGIPQRPGQARLDLAALGRSLAALARAIAPRTLRLEPGRFLVAEAGVLLAPVTLVRSKGATRFIGLATGMNSLVRPMLYGAWHPIVNLTRLDEPPAGTWHVVGPICETGDILGRDRLLPETLPGDVVLIDNVGAYGAVMASRYNLREPAEEIVIEK